MNPDIALTPDFAAQSPASPPTRPRFPAWLASLAPIERQAFGRLHALAVEHLRSTYSINPQLPGWLGWANAMARLQFEESSMPKDTPSRANTGRRRPGRRVLLRARQPRPVLTMTHTAASTSFPSAGHLEVDQACRTRLKGLASIIQYARSVVLQDPRRAVVALQTGMQSLEEFAVDLDMLLVHAASADVRTAAPTSAALLASTSTSTSATASCDTDTGNTSPPITKRQPARLVLLAGARTAPVLQETRKPLVAVRTSGPKPPSTLAYNHEQAAVIEAEGASIMVDAGAGTGKTTTLVGVAAARPKERILSLSYNRAVADEARQRFGPNVECYSTHGLAFKSVGKFYRHKIGKPRARDIRAYLEATMPGALPLADTDHVIQLALCAVDRYIASATYADAPGRDEVEEFTLLPSGSIVDGDTVAQLARQLWRGMTDRSERRVALSHDAYLKLFQLGQPDLSHFDRVLLDEAQDQIGSVLEVIERHPQHLLVGDDAQSIYAYRHAVNAMRRGPNSLRLPLTQSHRFGPNVAWVANAILGTFKPGSRLIQGMGGHARRGPVSTARILRTNAALFAAAAEWITARDDPKASRPSWLSRDIAPDAGLHFVGGVERYGFEKVIEMHHLRQGGRKTVHDGFLRQFADYDCMVSYAQAVDDKELLARIKIVERFGARVPYLANAMQQAHVASVRADVHLCTAHSSKGLEFDVVWIGPDFQPLLSDKGIPRSRAFALADAAQADTLEDAEVHLQYVAATRARLELVPSTGLARFLAWKQAQDAVPARPVPAPAAAGMPACLAHA